MASPTMITSLLIRLVDRVTGPIKRIIAGVKGVEGAGKKAAAAFKLAANMKQGADAVADFSRQATSLVEQPIKKFADFQEQMSSVKAATFDLTKTMDASQIRLMDAAMVDLNATARRLGKDTKYSATEVAAGMDILAKNFSGTDLEKAKAIGEAIPGILSTAAATKESIENVSDIQSAAMNQFGLTAADMGKIGDIFVKTANGTATGLVDLGEALKYSGVTAKNANIDLATTLGMIGALGNAGKKGSVAGTGLASVLGNLQSGMKKQKSALKALGIDISDKQGNLKPIVDLLVDIEKAADKKFGKGKGGVRRDRWLQGLVGMGGDKEALAILMKQAGTGELQALVEANKNASQGIGAAAMVAAEMNNNAAGAAKNLNSAYEELQLTIGEQVIPQVTDLLKWLIEVVNSFSAWAKENPLLVKGLVGIVGTLGIFGMVVAPVIKGVAALITIWGGLTWAWGKASIAAVAAGKAVRTLGTTLKTAFLSNPLGIILLIAEAAYLIYENWEPIAAFFSGLWDSITAGFKAALDWIVGKLEWAHEKIVGLRDAVLGINEVAVQQGRQQVAGMTAEQLRALQNVGGGVSDIAGQALQAQRLVASVAGAGAPQAANGPPAATGAPLLEGDGPTRSQFDGELKITINSDGTVKKQELKTRGGVDFKVRANVGGQVR